MKLLFVATELFPYARAGGMGSVMHDLPHALASLGHDVRVIIPKYLSVDKELPLTTEIENLEVPTGNVEKDPFITCHILKLAAKEKQSVTTYFLDNEEYYGNRANIYGYGDDTLRFSLLCKATLEFLRFSEWTPDTIVSNDWHTGFLPNYLKTEYQKYSKLQTISTLFIIHNLHFQGNFKHQFVDELNHDDGRGPMPAFEDPRLFNINGIKRGIMYSNAISTVSPTYAKEIMTEEYGEGVQDLLIERKDAVFGIINGISYKNWNPEKDSLLAHHFNYKNLEKREENRLELAEKLGLEITPKTFVIGLVSRMSAQKGFDLLNGVMKSLIRELDLALVVVGEGDSRYMEFFEELHKKFPTRVAVQFRFDPSLPHLVFGGVDSVLIPSKFEPSGLTQMEAMHYGAVPIVRKTGGLADTVKDYLPGDAKGTGFVFNKFDSFSMLIAITRAYENFQNKEVWQCLQKSGMKKDFSWENSAKQYEKLFEKARELQGVNILDPKSKTTIKD